MEKDWKGNSRSTYVILGASNHTDKEREENDFYATDPRAIDDLLKYESFNENIWECACGKGHLSKRLKERGYKVYSTDLINRGYGDAFFDYLSLLENPIYEWDGDIITNPPYKFTTEFILRSLDLIKDGNKVAMFLKLQTLEGQDRYKKIYKNNPPKYIYI